MDFEPFRRELVVHCYRMLGSVTEAEDVVQETMLRAWRSRYDPARASLRTWLFRIATNACLTALEGRARRPLPSGLGAPSTDPQAPLVPDFEVPWLQPLPGDISGVRLAFVAALQVLPARQRAVLLLRDVLQFSAAEVAGQLGTSPAAVNSALQRARTTLDGLDPESVREPDDRVVRQTVEKYVRAFEAADVPGLVALLTEDAVLEMPPVPLWYVGRPLYGRFMERVFAMRGSSWRVFAIRANGQPALAAVTAGTLHSLQVLTVTDLGIARNVVFMPSVIHRRHSSR